MNTKYCMHENILPYFDIFIEEEHLWIVTFASELGTCKNMLRNTFKDGMNEARVSFILKGILQALVYMHESRMIHNDIRADNIVIDILGQVRLTGLRQVTHLSKNGEYLKSIYNILGDNVGI